jgi:hypothetical protein
MRVRAKVQIKIGRESLRDRENFELNVNFG